MTPNHLFTESRRFPFDSQINIQLVNLPRDIETYFFHRSLIKIVGAKQAGWLAFRLWIELSYATEWMARAGDFDLKRKKEFLKDCESATAFDELIQSGWLRLDGATPFCFLFQSKNRHLGRDYTHVDPRIDRTVDHWINQAMSDAASLTPKVPPELWTTATNVTINPDEMNRIVVFIRIVENIYGELNRPVAIYEPGMVNACFDIITKFNSARLQAFLRIFVNKWQRFDPELNLPKTAALFFREFEKTYYRLLPEHADAYGAK